MSIFSRFLPKRKPVQIKNNIPKEKANIKKRFSIYCHSHHGTSGDKLCPKCQATLMTALTRISRCPYGITKPVCERCDTPCFGEKPFRDFCTIMSSGGWRMALRHPMMAFRHRMARMGVDYARYKKQKDEQKKVSNKEKKQAKKAEKSKK